MCFAAHNAHPLPPPPKNSHAKPKPSPQPLPPNNNNHHQTKQVKQSVLVVGELVDIVSGEQRYLHRKLERHIKTCVRFLGRGWGWGGAEDGFTARGRGAKCRCSPFF
jgi:hypothetical protein